jgi:UDP-glucuronate decarboxylase
MTLASTGQSSALEETQRTAVVTGGAGFIGSHLCDQLIARGRRVLCIDNLYTGSLDNIRPLLNHPDFSFIKHDITEPLAIAGPVDRIYNLACAASPVHYQRDPIGTMRTCVIGAHHVLELADRRGRASCKRPPARSTATRRCIPNARTTSAM